MNKKSSATKINKSQLINQIATKLSHYDGKNITRTIDAILDYLISNLAAGRRVEIRGFGSFALRYRPSRNARNPRTGEKLVTPPKYVLRFKPSKELSKKVNTTSAKSSQQ